MTTAQPQPARRPVEPGWYLNLPNEDYHRRTEGISSGQLKLLTERTVAHLQQVMAQPEKEPTPAMQIGSAVHTLVLEPGKFAAEVTVAPEVNKRTNAGKADWAAFEAESAGKTILTAEQLERVEAMADAALANPIISTLVNDAVRESSVFWWDETSGHMLKVRPDGICRSHAVLLDLKTTDDASYTTWAKRVHSFQYHFSAAMYLEGVNQCRELLAELRQPGYTRFVHLVVESEPPHLTAVYELGREYLDLGWAMYRRALRTLGEVNRGEPKGYPEDIRILEPPPWAHRAHIV